MPLYEVEHFIGLNGPMKSRLALGITKIHSEIFTTPSLFVNVRFTDVSSQDTYVGGMKKRTNRVLAHVRPGGDRSTEKFHRLCRILVRDWDLAINGGEEGKDDHKLHSVFILGTIVAGSEAGLLLPPAGQDREWIKSNMGLFHEKAKAGNEDCKDLLKEIEERKELR